jgi:hypothetical protein
MRPLVSRKLSASGYSIGQKLKFRGVETTCVTDARGRSMLLVSNVFFGPTWAQIHKALEKVDPAPTLISFGNTPSVLISDSASSREVIASLFDTASSSRGNQVHLEDVGFVELESKAKIDIRRFALPLVSIVCVIGIAFFWRDSSKPTDSLNLAPAAKVCIVDSTSSEFQSWLIDSLSDEKPLSSGIEIRKSTASGELNIVVEGTIGSAAQVIGTAACDDGRERSINHRIDTSSSGEAFELGQ